MTSPVPPTRASAELDSSSSPAAGGWVVTITGSGDPITAELRPGARAVVGRDAAATLRVAHVSVSRRHLALEVGDTVRIVDLGSTNGTRVDGQTLAPNVPFELASGTVVEVGSVDLVVARAGEPSVVPPRGAGSVTTHGVAVSSTLIAIAAEIENRAPADATLLVVGERGVGRSSLAELLHARSARRHAPFLSFPCGDAPAATVERELLGQSRVARDTTMPLSLGMLSKARGGTLCLDAIEELPLSVQARLAEVLRQRRASSPELRALSDARVVATTERDLAIEVERGTFRRDLFDEIAAFSWHIPPLRARRHEVAMLAATFAQDVALVQGVTSPPSFSTESLAALALYEWPGNVGELRRVVERAVSLSHGATIRVPDLHLPVKTRPEV